MRAVERAGEVDIHHPGIVLGGEIPQACLVEDRGVVDQDIEALPAPVDLGDERVDAGAVGDVQPARHAHSGGQSGGDGLRFGQVDIRQNHARAFRAQPHGNCLADSARRAVDTPSGT